MITLLLCFSKILRIMFTLSNNCLTTGGKEQLMPVHQREKENHETEGETLK